MRSSDPKNAKTGKSQRQQMSRTKVFVTHPVSVVTALGGRPTLRQARKEEMFEVNATHVFVLDTSFTGLKRAVVEQMVDAEGFIFPTATRKSSSHNHVNPVNYVSGKTCRAGFVLDTSFTRFTGLKRAVVEQMVDAEGFIFPTATRKSSSHNHVNPVNYVSGKTCRTGFVSDTSFTEFTGLRIWGRTGR